MEKALNAISDNEIGGTITSSAGSSKAPDKRRGESLSDHSIPQVFRNEPSYKLRTPMDIKNKPHNEKQNKNKRKQNELWLIIPQCDPLASSNICETAHATSNANFNQKLKKEIVDLSRQ